MSKYLNTKPGSIEEVTKSLLDDYQTFFKKELEKTGKSISSMTDAEKKAFFNKVDKGYNAKNETHVGQTKDANQQQKDAKGEKEVLTKESFRDTIKNLWIEAAKKEEEDKEKETDIDKIKLAKEKDTDALEKQLVALQGQNNVLKQKLENEKHKAIKPQPNPDTGEVPLTVGIAYKHLKDKMKKEEKMPEPDDKNKEKKGKTLVGSKQTKLDMEPNVDYKN